MPAGKPCHIVWDRDLTGFGVLLQGLSCRSWIVCWTRRRAGRSRRVTLGRVADIGADRARELAAVVINRLPPRATARHGLSATKLHAIWRQMRSRCRDVNHPRFTAWGGRGITVDPRWDSFPAFLADMGERPSAQHSIDRIDNDLGYSAANCRWATAVEQAANKRRPETSACAGRDTIEWI
jgi:hypothetical protein